MFSKADINAFLNFFVDMIREVRANISPSNLYNSACVLPLLYMLTAFTPAVATVTALLGKPKVSICPNDVLLLLEKIAAKQLTPLFRQMSIGFLQNASNWGQCPITWGFKWHDLNPTLDNTQL